MKLLRSAYIPALLSAVALCAPVALAQNAQPQNLGHFYMARQQVHIIDESPMVTRETLPAGQAGGGNLGAQPGAMNRPMPLPRAGFQGYFKPSGSSPASSLPSTANGVPVPAPAPPGGPGGKKAKAGAIKPKTASAGGTKPAGAGGSAGGGGPTTAKAYNPYGGYGSGPAAGTVQGNSSTGMSTNRQVKGSIMNWKRTRGF